MNNLKLDPIYKLNLNEKTTIVFSQKSFKKINVNSDLVLHDYDFLDENLKIENKFLLVKNLLNFSIFLGMKKWSLFDFQIYNNDSIFGIESELGEDYQQYCCGLLSSFITTGATPLVAEYLYNKFLEKGLFDIANHYKKIKLEEGPHQKLCIADLNDLRIDYSEIFSHYRFEKEESMVEYFWKLAKSKEPLATLGYAYALEKTALIFNTPQRVDEITELLGEKASATRCLKAHMSTSHEKEHVDESLRLISALNNKVISQIAKATFETSSKMNNPFLKIKKL